MSRKTWVRRPADRRETLGAAAVAVGVGGVVFWLVRTLLARDSVGRRRETSDGETSQGQEKGVAR